MIDLDDIKVGLAAFAGLTHHWLLDLNAVLSVLVTLVTLVYVVLKVRGLIRKDK